MTQDKEKILVAVYGSLKKGFGNHGLLSDSKFIDKGCTFPNYKLISMGSYPAALVGKKSLAVEIYEVSQKTLERLDQLEGHPSFYTRRFVPINTPNGREFAWMYTLCHLTSNYSHRPEYINIDENGHISWDY
jgi:gamma-glutamylcyclotransferase (GGCT)/AIG2-like uncharacterized protein YtfP